MNSDSQSQEDLSEDFFNPNFYDEQYYYQYQASPAGIEDRFHQLWPFSEPDQAF